MYIVKMFSTDFVCFYFKSWDQAEGTEQTGQGGQVIDHDLPNVHFIPYMDVKGVCLAQPWPSHHVSYQPWPFLQFSWSILTLGLSIYGISQVCVMHIYSQRSNISLQAMELHGHFHPHLQQKCVVREYYSHGLEYYLYSYKRSIL